MTPQLLDTIVAVRARATRRGQTQLCLPMVAGAPFEASTQGLRAMLEVMLDAIAGERGATREAAAIRSALDLLRKRAARRKEAA